MLYFAYGSNMDWTQMKERCPSARFIGVAMLLDHRLAFTRKSIHRGCGVADVVCDVGSKVWGVVYDVSDVHVGQLDKSEGYRPGREKNFYWRHECIVFVDGDDGKPVNAATYFGAPEPNVPLPNQAYKDLILAGARYWQLPAEYVSDLDCIEVAA